jgi:translation initiation factor IF-2
MTDTSPNIKPPVVAIMGHIDHGKSTLLDYIRKTNVVADEAGGITQHLSAYEIKVPYQGSEREITFLDTPGHAAFTGMRERGASVADIAILVVSAEDGVKAQTIEALETIRAAQIPFIVAINKIDRPNANIEHTKLSLAEQNVLVEGFGGTVPVVAISAKEGTGVTELLDTILLVADLEGFIADPTKPAEGVVIESHLDQKRGVAATIVITDGTLKKGQFVFAGGAVTGTRIMENFLGKPIEKALPGTPVQLVGFDMLPEVGAHIVICDSKRDAEECAHEARSKNTNEKDTTPAGDIEKILPIIIKGDTSGTVEAIEQEIKKIAVDGLWVKIIGKGIGAISENDIRVAHADKNAIILGFNVSLDPRARDANEQAHVNVQTFDVIYRLVEWLSEELERQRPRKEVREVAGTAKVLKTFSKTKERQVLGCRVDSGRLIDGAMVTILRRDFPIASGTIVEIQQAKQRVKEVESGECGVMIECKNDIAPGDVIEAFILTTK